MGSGVKVEVSPFCFQIEIGTFFLLRKCMGFQLDNLTFVGQKIIAHFEVVKFYMF